MLGLVVRCGCPLLCIEGMRITKSTQMQGVIGMRCNAADSGVELTWIRVGSWCRWIATDIRRWRRCASRPIEGLANKDWSVLEEDIVGNFSNELKLPPKLPQTGVGS